SNPLGGRGAGSLPGQSPNSKAKGKPAPSEPKDTFREVVETVVFVVVLVLLLKTFLAEAFVIPTGSMATTLLGYHKDVVCKQCGYHDRVNSSTEVEGQENVKIPVYGFMCQNCRALNDFVEQRETIENSSGDRVLVAKFLWDLGLAEPKRQDVVVFKFPEKPIKNHVPTNYIKRLLGLPGEIIAFFFGRLYVFDDFPVDDLYDDEGKKVPQLELWKIRNVEKRSKDMGDVAIKLFEGDAA